MNCLIKLVFFGMVLSILSACNLMYAPGIEPVRDVNARYEKCGLSILPPQIEGVRYLNIKTYPELYNTMCGMVYSISRENYIYSFDFGVLYIPASQFFKDDQPLEVLAENYIRNQEVKYEHILEEVEVEKTTYLGLDAIRYKEVRLATYIGDKGTRAVTIGYLFPHPDNEHWVVNAHYIDGYRESDGEKPDKNMRELAEQFLNNIHRIPLKEDEKTGEARDRFFGVKVEECGCN